VKAPFRGAKSGTLLKRVRAKLLPDCKFGLTYDKIIFIGLAPVFNVKICEHWSDTIKGQTFDEMFDNKKVVFVGLENQSLFYSQTENT